MSQSVQACHAFFYIASAADFVKMSIQLENVKRPVIARVLKYSSRAKDLRKLNLLFECFVSLHSWDLT